MAIILLISMAACKGKMITLQEGDLLFRDPVSEKLSLAIDRVTQTSEKTHFSHMGMAELVDNNIYVLHATPAKGACRVTLNEFLHPGENLARVTVYRLKKPWRKSIPAAIQRATEMLGKPYNDTYIPSDYSFYCSDFIYRAFAPDSVFTLAPMTFKDPHTGQFNEEWVQHYKKLGIDIPEGLPGCNPNGMAASQKIERLGILNQ